MKILFLAPQPFFEIRGTPIAILEMVKALNNMGHKVDIVTYHLGRDINDENLEGVKIFRILKIPFIKRVSPGASYRKAFLDSLIFIKALKMCLLSRYDVIHAVEESAYLGVILSKIFKRPLIYDMDSSIPAQLYYSGFMKNQFLIGLVRRIESWVIENSDMVITVCEGLTRDVLNRFPGKPVFQIEDRPLFDGIRTNKEEVDELRRTLGLERDIVVLYTGNFEPYQGIDMLLRAIPYVTKKVDSVRFLLVGGEDSHIDIYIRLARDIGVEAYVTFVGKRPLNEMPIYMEMADILVSPRKDGMNTPMKIYSYLASGKPVVATSLPAHTQILNNEIAVIVDNTAEGIASGIIKLADNVAFRTELGRKGMEYVSGNFNYEMYLTKVKEAYGKVEQVVRCI